MLGITEAFDKPRTDYVTAVMGSQMSKTDGVLLNVIGRTMDDDPRPIIYIGPTQKNVESISNDRVTKMIEGVPSLYAALSKGRNNKTSEKFLHGVRLGFGWAGSATEVASHPAAIALVDERDRMDDIPGEGDINGLLEPRVATYDGVIGTTSTPLEGDVTRDLDENTGLDHWVVGDKDDVSSPTWLLWQEGSRHEWAWPCPECKDYFIPWSGILFYPDEATDEEAFSDAKLGCPRCGSEIREARKEWMNDRGVFVAPGQTLVLKDDHALVNDSVVPFGSYLDSHRKAHVSFWVSGLCTPWRTFGHRARAYVAAKRSGQPGREQAAVNTGFGELYKPSGTAPEWEQIKELKRGHSRGTLPPEAQVLTAGVDVQKDSLYWSVRAWGPNYGSWLVDNGQIFGDTKHPHVWSELSDILNSPIEGKPIALMLVDSGFKPNEGPAENSIIYQFCRRHSKAFPAKGYDTRPRTHSATKVDVTVGGRLVKEGLTLWHLSGDYFKSLLYARMEWQAEGQPGGWYLHSDTEDEYCRQVVAETRLVLSNGRPKWESLRKANHYLDCEMMNFAAAHILRLHRLPSAEEGATAQPRRRGRRVLNGGINRDG